MITTNFAEKLDSKTGGLLLGQLCAVEHQVATPFLQSMCVPCREVRIATLPQGHHLRDLCGWQGVRLSGEKERCLLPLLCAASHSLTWARLSLGWSVKQKRKEC